MADIAFKEGTASAYSKITPDSHTFYHTTDDDQVYLGSIPLNSIDKYLSIEKLGVVGGITGGAVPASLVIEEDDIPQDIIDIFVTGDNIGVDSWKLSGRGSTSYTGSGYKASKLTVDFYSNAYFTLNSENPNTVYALCYKRNI